jgi:predicted nuclease with TOPRIM domain
MKAPSPAASLALSLSLDTVEVAFPDELAPDESLAKRAAAPVAPNPRRVLVLDQGEDPPAAYAVAAALNYLREDGRRDPVSTRFLLAAAQAVDRPSGVGEEPVASALLVLREMGAVGADAWPAEAVDAPPEVASRTAFEERFRLERVVRVPALRGAVEQALAEKPALVVEAEIHAGWSDPVDGAIRTTGAEEPLGQHAFCVLGCDADGLLVQGSWGPEWGGARVGDEPRAGLARWSWDDFEKHARRAWQLHLPPTEEFQPEVRPRAGYCSDAVSRRDRLGIEREVEALAMVIASRDVQPPLSIGLFGDWGVGKSFFLERLEAAVRTLTDSAQEIEDRRHANGDDGLSEPAYWAQVAHIRFNAWHFADANLWASLVVRIFDGLARHLAIKKDRLSELDAEREALLKRLESEHAEVKRLVGAHDAVEKELGESERKLQAAEEEVAAQQEELERIDLGADAARLWNQRVLADPRFRAAVEDLGLPAAVEGFAELRAALAAVRGEADRTLRRVAEVFAGGGAGRKVALAGIALAGLAAPSLVALVVEAEAMQALLARLSMVGTWAVGLLVGVPRWLERVNASFREIDRVLPEVRRAESPEEHARVTEQKERVDELRAKRDGLRANVEERRVQVAALEDQLRERRVGRELYRFVEAKADSADYQAKLGIVSAIREDLQLLSDLLARQGTLKRAAWDPRRAGAPPELDTDVDRIVLYVDDLDRCPPERVVEILQAVHLLLAFPLFVVVVAVDSRWLLRALRKEYADFLAAEEDEDERDRVPPSTPQDYLEKIFQIALTIKPMALDGYEALLDDLVPRPLRTDAGEQAQGGNGFAPRPAHLPAGESVHALAPFVDLNPPSLDVPEREVAIMKRLYGFLETPRAVKRFVNTYRLLRASLEPRELAQYVEPASSAPEAVLVLLAVLTGFPELAERVFRALAMRPETDAWAPFLDGFELEGVYEVERPLAFQSLKHDQQTAFRQDPNLRRLAYYRNDLDERIDSGEREAWELLRTLLGAFTFATLGDLQPWIARVARYAIRPVSLDLA